MTAPFTYNGVPFSPVRGWNATKACHYSPSHGLRFVAFKQPRSFTLTAYGRTWAIQMPARGIRTIRPTTTTIQPFAFNGDPSDFSGGNAQGVNPCGDPEPVDVHDAIFARCAVALNDPLSGRMLGLNNVLGGGYNLSGYGQLPGYPAPVWPLCYDGEHRIRAYRVGIKHLDDPFVQMDLKALLLDSKLFWKPYGDAILKGPGGHGHGYVGRSWSWTAYLSWLVGDTAFTDHMIRVARHVIDPATGSPQRLVNPDTHGGVGFWGSPQPWKPKNAGGSNVPAQRDVFQDLEASHQVAVFAKLGMHAEAIDLAETMLARPLRKWIDCETGLGLGDDYADPAQAWLGIGALAEIDKPRALEYAKTWPIMRDPKVYGGSVGPFPTLAQQREALVAQNEPGKTAWFLEATK